jgi:hypothetical protein
MIAASLHPFLTHANFYLSIAAPYVALGAMLIALIAVALLLVVRRRLSKLALGRSGSIEESITILSRDVKEFQKFRGELEQYLKIAEARLRGSVQGVGVVRFNAFAGSTTGGGAGGNQSFSIALLDEEASGVVLSTLYSRNHVGVYAKPVEKGSSSFELTAEERNAIEQATRTIATHKKRA